MRYSEKQVQAIVAKFLVKFDSDKRSADEKYNQLGFGKGTWYRLRNGFIPTRLVFESIVAFLEDRIPKHVELSKKKKFACISCQKIFPTTKKHYQCYRCIPCQLAFYQEANKRYRKVIPKKKQTYFRYEE